MASAPIAEWRALLREVPKLGWQDRMAKALDAACDEIERLEEQVRVHHKRAVAAESLLRPKGGSPRG